MFRQDNSIYVPIFKVGKVNFGFIDYSKTYIATDGDFKFLKIFGETGKPKNLEFTGWIPQFYFDGKMYYCDTRKLTYGLFMDSYNKTHTIVFSDLDRSLKLPSNFVVVDCEHEKIAKFRYTNAGIALTDNVCIDCQLTLSTIQERIPEYAVTDDHE